MQISFIHKMLSLWHLQSTDLAYPEHTGTFKPLSMYSPHCNYNKQNVAYSDDSIRVCHITKSQQEPQRNYHCRQEVKLSKLTRSTEQLLDKILFVISRYFQIPQHFQINYKNYCWRNQPIQLLHKRTLLLNLWHSD